MGEIRTQNQKIGFLVQPIAVRTQGTKDPVGTGITSLSWTNTQDKTDTFYQFRAEPQALVYNSNPAIATLSEMSTTSMFAESSRTYVDKKNGLPTLDLTIYATPTSAVALFLTSLFTATQDATAPYLKTFTPANSELDFTNNQGFLLTVAGMGYNDSSTSVGDGFILQNAVVNKLTLTSNNRLGDVNQRFMKFDISLIGQKLIEKQYIGNWTDGAETIYNGIDSADDLFTLSTLDFDGSTLTDVCYRQFQLTINNNIKSDCMTTDGYANGFKRSNPEVTYSIDIPHNDITYQYLNSFTEGTNVKITFKNGYTSADDGYFAINLTKSVLTSPIITTEGDYISQRLQGRVLFDGTSWGDFIQIADNYEWDLGITA